MSAFLDCYNPEVVRKKFDILMNIEENYPDLLYSDKPLFIAPADNSLITPEIKKVLDGDTESLIWDIIKYYRDGAEGKPVVPEKLLESNPYNREIMEILRQIGCQ